MNSKTSTPRTSSVRRVVPAVAIVVLAIGLGACQTPPRGTVAPQQPVVQSVPVPESIDAYRTADRIAEYLARDAAQVHLPSWTDRITAQIEYEASLTVKTAQGYSGMTADRIEERLARESAAPSDALHRPVGIPTPE